MATSLGVALAQLSLKGLIKPDPKWERLFRRWLIRSQLWANSLEIRRTHAINAEKGEERVSAYREYIFMLMPALKVAHEKELADLAKESDEWVKGGDVTLRVGNTIKGSF